MPRPRLRLLLLSIGSFAASWSMGCSQVIGLSDMSVDESAGGVKDKVPRCSSNAQCTEEASKDTGTIVPAMCIKSTGACAVLTSEDCSLVTGDYTSDQAVVIGSLFQTEGATATQNIPRQRSATLAVEEVNTAGGIPSSTAGVGRPLVMVSCNAATDLVRAARHLVDDLKVPAIVGPNNSQDTLDVSNKVTISAGVAVLTPTAVAASISDLLDKDLTWLMIPSDDQRAQLMIKQINDLEAVLKQQRGTETIKLSIIYRNDALGMGTRNSLERLVLNGFALSHPSNAGSAAGNVHVVPYDYKQADQNAIVEKESAFAPDMVVLAGTAESITKVLTPLEQAWKSNNRPYYFIIDPSKGPELLGAVVNNEDLRHRIRGTGTMPATESIPVANAFNIDYSARYNEPPTASGAGTCYDAVYSVAYALAATKDVEPSGAKIAEGLRMLSGGAVSVNTGPQDLLAAFQNLASGKTINAFGTACPLDWDQNGTVKGGRVDMWCISGPNNDPRFGTSGLVFDIRTQAYSGEYVQCP